MPAFTEPYRKGWQLAVEEINAAGGINGKKLVVISKDDGGKPADAQTAANELVSSENVAMLTGTFLSNIGLAVSDFANQKKVFFLAAEPLTDAITWSKGNRYTFRLRPSNYMQAAMLVEEAAKLPAKRWATIAPNYEYGQSAVAVFKKLMSEKRPDIQWVDEQWPPQGKIDAGPVVQAVAAANPEAILNVTFGADLVKLEHAAAILHPKLGKPVREVLSKGAALIPSSKKRSGPGTTLDIPLGHKDAAFVRSHFDGMEVQINDAPRANEIMVAVAVTDSGRPLPRVGGLTVSEVKGEDELM